MKCPYPALHSNDHQINSNYFSKDIYSYQTKQIHLKMYEFPQRLGKKEFSQIPQLTRLRKNIRSTIIGSLER